MTLHAFSTINGGMIIAELISSTDTFYTVKKAVQLVPRQTEPGKIDIGIAPITTPLGDGDPKKQAATTELNRAGILLVFDISKDQMFAELAGAHKKIFSSIIQPGNSGITANFNRQ